MIFDPQAEPLFCQSTDCTSRFVGVDVLAVPLYTSMGFTLTEMDWLKFEGRSISF